MDATSITAKIRQRFPSVSVTIETECGIHTILIVVDNGTSITIEDIGTRGFGLRVDREETDESEDDESESMSSEERLFDRLAQIID